MKKLGTSNVFLGVLFSSRRSPAVFRFKARYLIALIASGAASLAPGHQAFAAPVDAALDADASARAPAVDVRMAPSPAGVFGAWLVAGPFRAGKPALDAAPLGVDEATLTPSANDALAGERDLGAKKRPPARWMLASTGTTAGEAGSSGDRPLDLKAALEASGLTDVVGYAAGALTVPRAGRYLLLLGVDDGVRVSVDGRVLYTRDDARPLREDDDVIPLDLEAGEHKLLFKLHQRDGAWALRVRIVDSALAPVPGAYVRLPGTSAEDARTLASKMSLVSIERTFDTSIEPARYRPRVTARFPEGAPRGVPLPVTARLMPATGDTPIFDVQAGGVPVTAKGIGELAVALPTLGPWSGTSTLETNVAGRIVRSAFPARPLTEQALARMDRALAKVDDKASWLVPGSLDSARFLATRLKGLVSRGDLDVEAQVEEAHELDKMAAALERNVDPFDGRTGPMRRAIRSTIDGEPSEFGLYVPPWFKAGGTRKYPLVVGLHGLNGHALGMMRWLFGGDDPKHDQGWEDRHVGPLPPLDAFIVTPYAHGNTLYRELGEVDVMKIVEWAMRTYPIDPARVTITGPSMGGIGSAALPLHMPHRFAAAAPLCGYHSYLIRSDVSGRPIRPWERFVAEERSNVLWAENGEHLPLWIVHGTQDLPEENSGVLIEQYEKLKFSIKHEHPDKGHNVWQETYDELKGLKWLLNRGLDLHPAHVRFKTTRTRWNKSAWVTVDELASEATWGDVDARVRGKKRITATTTGISAITFARDASLLDAASAIDVGIDGQTVSFEANEPLVLHKEGTSWRKDAAPHTAVFKHGTITGPIRDVFYEPILFVYAGSDGKDGDDEARANEQVARTFARIRGGVRVSYPVMSDLEFLARGEPLANDRALFLVGRKNRVLAALERTSAGTPELAFPIKIDASSVTVGQQRFTGTELGAAFIRPNPARPDRYVVVVAGADVPGTLRALSLPDLLPDFVVWDHALAPSRGAVLLGSGSVRAGGFFTKDWALPKSIDDPLAKRTRAAVPSATEGDPTP